MSNPGSTIKSDTTWSGVQNITESLTVEAGVTLTIAAGTEINVAKGVGISVEGTIDATAGTSAEPIKIGPTSAIWDGMEIGSTGTVNYSYVTEVGGAFRVDGGTVKMTDSTLTNSAGVGITGIQDLIIVTGGNVNVQYSQLGIGSPTDASPGTGDTTHCNFHINSVSSLVVNHSNIVGTPYGLMVYAPTTGTPANLQDNNFNAGANNYDFEPGEDGLADVTGSFFNSGSITPGTPNTTGTLSKTPVAAGPRS